jgi:Zn-dependent M28 family amino/carboxypeptidase
MFSSGGSVQLTGRGVLGTLVLLAALGAVGVAVSDCSTDRSTQPPESRKTVSADASGTSELLKAVTTKGILEHERRFQALAEAHGNTRAAGTPGYRESREYVADRLRRAGYGVRVQSFEFPFFRVLAPLELARVSPDPHPYELREDFAPMQYSGSGEVTAQLEPVDISPSPGGEPGPSTSGCEESDFTGFDEGDVAFLQRGTCTFEEKAKNAEAAGASAALIFNNSREGNKTEPIRGTLGKPGVTIPVLGTSFADGEDLLRMTQGGEVTVHVFASTVSETREASNVIADTEEGREDQTVVVGAHLDSVPEGPGINDNGSGSATVLEIAEKMSELGIEPRNRVRFAFWGAEEPGLFGSKYYVTQLDERKLGELAVYLNFDMVASPNYVRFIYGSGEVREVFENFFATRDLKAETVDLKGRSDHGPFAAEGIAVGGLFSGAEGRKTGEQAEVYGGEAGVAYDGCYHEACDEVGNLSTKALEQLSDGAAYATYVFAREERR